MFSEFGRQVFRDLSNKCLAGSQTCTPSFQKILVTRNKIFEKKDDCITVFGFLDLSEKLWQGCQNCILRAWRKFLKHNNFFDEKLCSLCFCCFSAKVPRNFGENFAQGYQNCFLHVDGKRLWK